MNLICPCCKGKFVLRDSEVKEYQALMKRKAVEAARDAKRDMSADILVPA